MTPGTELEPAVGAARRHAREIVAPGVAGWEREARFPREAVEAAARAGLCGLFAPVEVGGRTHTVESPTNSTTSKNTSQSSNSSSTSSRGTSRRPWAYVGNLHRAYGAAGPRVRRQINQAIFKRILVSSDGDIIGELRPPFDLLLRTSGTADPDGILRQAAKDKPRASQKARG